MERSREAFAGQVQCTEWVADVTIFDSRIVAGDNKMMLRIYNCQMRTDEEMSTIIYGSTEPMYFFDLGWSISLSSDINVQIIVANRKLSVVEEPR